MRFLSILCISTVFLLVACEVEQTEEGELPEVDVDVETAPGDLPEYDVNWADVDLGTTTRMVEVPKVVVTTETEEVEVPYLDVDIPEGGERIERTISVEAEVQEEADLEIQEVYATGNRLIVISELERTGQPLDEVIRISDRLVINAPDLDVKRYIIGEQPAGDFNTQFTYISSREEIADHLQDGRTIYSR